MSILKAIHNQLGISATNTQNFTWTAENSDGSMQLQRGVYGGYSQLVMNIDSSSNVNFPIGLLKANSIVQALSDFTGSNQSLGTSGYQKLPGGLIIQWGTYSTSSSASTAVSFPIAFPNSCLLVYSVNSSIGASNGTTTAYSQTTTGFTADAMNPSGSRVVVPCSYIAIGK